MSYQRLSSAQQNQKGISLVITLLMLVALTLIGVAALNNNNLQVKMAYNSAESNSSFQNAENGIIYAEKWLQNQPILPIAATNCAPPCALANPVWKPAALTASGDILQYSWWSLGNARRYDFNYPDDGSAATAAANRGITAGANQSAIPLYVVEEIGSDDSSGLTKGRGQTYKLYYYRITGLGYGAQAQSGTLTQSIFARTY